MVIGYARGPKAGQCSEPQPYALQQAGCELVWNDKATRDPEARHQLRRALKALRKGDVSAALAEPGKSRNPESAEAAAALVEGTCSHWLRDTFAAKIPLRGACPGGVSSLCGHSRVGTAKWSCAGSNQKRRGSQVEVARTDHRQILTLPDPNQLKPVASDPTLSAEPGLAQLEVPKPARGAHARDST